MSKAFASDPARVSRKADLVREPGQVVPQILLHDLAVVFASYGTQIHLGGLRLVWISVPAGPGYGRAGPAGNTGPPLHPAGMTFPMTGALLRPDTAGPNTPDSWN